MTGRETRTRASRRGEVERRFAACGPDGRFPRRCGVDADEPPVLRLRTALADLGPLFAAFGRYLASRPDLLSETDCEVLAALPDHRPPMATEAVHALLLRELGRPPEEAFAAFDPTPREATLVHQEHRAVLHGGRPAMVRLVRDDLDAAQDRDLELLPLAAAALAAFVPAAGAAAAGGTVEDFAAALATAADLELQAAALSTLGRDGESPGLDPCAPLVVAALSGHRVLTREDPGGVSGDSFGPPPPSPAADMAAGGERGAVELAAQLCQAFLRQALAARPFPTELRGADVRVLAGGRVAWTGGAFAALPREAAGSLGEYFAAAAAHDPALASAALVRGMDGGPAVAPGSPGAPLDRQLRQLVPFRDGGWGATDDLAGYLFLHWRCATELGYRARPHLVLLYRGLASTAREARRLAPGSDPLRAGLEGLRLAAGLGGLAGSLSGAQAQQVLASYAAAMLAMPQRLDELLTLAAEGRASIKLELIEPRSERRRKDRAAAAMAGVAAMAAVVLLARQLAAAGVFGPWGERIGTVLLAVLGGWLLHREGGKGP